MCHVLWFESSTDVQIDLFRGFAEWSWWWRRCLSGSIESNSQNPEWWWVCHMCWLIVAFFLMLSCLMIFFCKEWPRSESARLQSMQSSASSLKRNRVRHVLMVTYDDEKQRVMGHSRIIFQSWLQNNHSCHESNQPPEYYIESFIIRKEMRGRGMGRIFMDMIEQFVVDTHHQKPTSPSGIKLSLLARDAHVQQFYSKLGFENFVSDSNETSISHVTTQRESQMMSFNVPPPPPPPLPLFSSQKICDNRKVLMSKILLNKSWTNGIMGSEYCITYRRLTSRFRTTLLILNDGMFVDREISESVPE